MTPRAKTPDELRDEILNHMRSIATYWSEISGPKTTQERIEGALFSTLAMLDGCSLGICAFDLVAQPHPEDKDFHIAEGENWVEPGTVISDMLHEHWHKPIV
jgi:hypothetical protein